MEAWIKIDLEEFMPTLTLISASERREILVKCSLNEVEAALQQGHISVEQAMWLHMWGMSWQINNQTIEGKPNVK